MQSPLRKLATLLNAREEAKLNVGQRISFVAACEATRSNSGGQRGSLFSCDETPGAVT